MSTWAALDIATVASAAAALLSIVGAISGVISVIRSRRETAARLQKEATLAGRNEVEMLFRQQNLVIERQQVEINALRAEVESLQNVNAENYRLAAEVRLLQAQLDARG